MNVAPVDTDHLLVSNTGAASDSPLRPVTFTGSSGMSVAVGSASAAAARRSAALRSMEFWL